MLLPGVLCGLQGLGNPSKTNIPKVPQQFPRFWHFPLRGPERLQIHLVLKSDSAQFLFCFAF